MLLQYLSAVKNWEMKSFGPTMLDFIHKWIVDV